VKFGQKPSKRDAARVPLVAYLQGERGIEYHVEGAAHQMKTVFEICNPRDDIRTGVIKESEFAADLSQVLNVTAPREYADPAVFFAHTYPTKGLRALLKNVCTRLVGQGGEAASIFRLDTQYGGGKTHSLIALAHAAHGMKGVVNAADFVEPGLVPKSAVKVAAFDGENADPSNGRLVTEGIRAFTPWGELAFALGGKPGFESIRTSDSERRAPGAENLAALLKGKPTLILVDELSIYLRKVKGRPEADQLTPFLTDLFKAVEMSEGAVLVFTLALRERSEGVDAYGVENEHAARGIEEAQKVAARKATVIDPTTADETALVLKRRLFTSIDDKAAEEVIQAYRHLWSDALRDIPASRVGEDRVAAFRDSYPIHPALLGLMTDKLSTLGNFQRVRGMLRLMAQTVANLWHLKPHNTFAIHLHHLDPAFEPIRNEIETRLDLNRFDPAMRNDVAAAQGSGKTSLAEQLDRADYFGMAPYGSFVARNILWHSFSFNEHLKGVAPEELRYSILAPSLDIGFINDARQKFVEKSAYLDDRTGVPLRFLTEANLNMLIRLQEDRVDLDSSRTELKDRIKNIFSGKTLDVIHFPGGPFEVPDEVGDGRPYLVLISHDAEAIPSDRVFVPPLVEKLFRETGNIGNFRQLQNNVVFVVADDGERERMKELVVRRLALDAMKQPDALNQLAEYQQAKLQELYRKSESDVAIGIQRCYRHIFFPSRLRVESSGVDLGHTALDYGTTAERPGDGQKHVVTYLREHSKKLLLGEDEPLAPKYVRDQTPLKKGQMTTGSLRNEFRKDPRLPILAGDDNFTKLIRKGVREGDYVYRSGELLVGPGDPDAVIRIDEQSFVYTVKYANEQGIWPRPKPTPDPGSAGGLFGAPPPSPSPVQPTTPETSGSLTFVEEAPLREALTRIFEAARAGKATSIRALSLRLFDASDAFKLLNVIASVNQAKRSLEMTAAYETRADSSFSMEFRGDPSDAGPIKEFLDAQFRAAKEKDIRMQYRLEFLDGLPLDGDQPEKLREKLTRYATGAAYVEARAETEA
jgi:hypothetical protein